VLGTNADNVPAQVGAIRSVPPAEIAAAIEVVKGGGGSSAEAMAAMPILA
jgi:hypothetical protein